MDNQKVYDMMCTLNRRRKHLEKRIDARSDKGLDRILDIKEKEALLLALWCIKKCREMKLINPGADDASR